MLLLLCISLAVFCRGSRNPVINACTEEQHSNLPYCVQMTCETTSVLLPSKGFPFKKISHSSDLKHHFPSPPKVYSLMLLSDFYQTFFFCHFHFLPHLGCFSFALKGFSDPLNTSTVVLLTWITLSAEAETQVQRHCALSAKSKKFHG